MASRSRGTSNSTPRPLPGAIEDSFSDFLGGSYKVYSRWQRNWRPIGREPEKRNHTTVHTINETIDKSVFDRWHRDPAYRPITLSLDQPSSRRRRDLDDLRHDRRSIDRGPGLTRKKDRRRPSASRLCAGAIYGASKIIAHAVLV